MSEFVAIKPKSLNSQPIREISAPFEPATILELMQGYEPVVLRGLARDWPLVAAANKSAEAAAEYLLGFDRDAIAEAFIGPPGIGGRFHYGDDIRTFNFERQRGRFSHLIRYLIEVQEQAAPPAVYAGAIGMAQALPGLDAANPMPLLDGLGAEPRIWIGNATRISTHFDSSDNVACVAAGRRRFTLFPPDQVSNLYIGPLDHTVAGQATSMVDMRAPDFERYPRFHDALAAARTAELEPGDAIYIPALWWHHVEAFGVFNVLVNYWWADSPDQDARFDAMIYGLLAIGDLPPVRREAWAALFDNYVFQRRGAPGAHLPEQGRGVLGAKTLQLRQYVKAFLMRGLGRP